MKRESIEDIKIANLAYSLREGRACWFGKNEMKFFSSRILPQVYEGRYFITSEKYESPNGSAFDGVRMYSIRECLDSGKIETIGKQMGYKSVSEAAMALLEWQVKFKGALS